MKEIFCDVAVVGSGPAGLAAAEAAGQNGAGRVLILERDLHRGGILQQCIHAGFGLSYFGLELTGPEYAERFARRAERAGAQWLLGTTATEIRGDTLVCVNRSGLLYVRFGALVLAMGCRERTRANLAIPGSRPAGIYTAGTAQKLINLYGYRIGREVVILGSGDIGMIMARRLTLEGAHVQAVVELLPYLAGLQRNRVQCLDDFGIPLLLGHTVTDITGADRVERVTIAPVDADRRPRTDQSRELPCDTLLLSVGLIPENELSRTGGVPLSGVTGGALVNQFMQTEAPAVFACGNALHVNDLVDRVSRESEQAGRCAALFARGELPSGEETALLPGDGVRYVCPNRLRPGGEDAVISFRVLRPSGRTRLQAVSGGRVLAEKIALRTSPGVLEQIVLPAAAARDLSSCVEITALPEEGET